jgi:hypothetical protein
VVSVSEAEKVSLAARNNALWCDVMLRAHGCRTSFQQDLWSSPDLAPRYYPNAVTLTGPEGVDEQMASIRQLVDQATELGRSLAIKDSFSTLPLQSCGCHPLFSADWLFRPPGGAKPLEPLRLERLADIIWAPLQSEDDLSAWERACERAWGLASDKPAEVGDLFPATLLTTPDVTVIAAYRRGQIIAGCIAYRSPGALGYTNMFLPAEDSALFRTACVAEIAGLFPGLPIVGYESGPDCAAMQACGFETIGELLIWLSA